MATQILTSTSIFLAPAAAIFNAGYGWAMTQNVMPLLYNDGAAHITTPIFRQIFYGGAFVAIPCSAGSLAMSAYLAYVSTDAVQRKLYLAATAMSLATSPITMLVMLPGIKRLVAISESQIEQEKCDRTLEHRKLLKSWSYWNGIRGMLYLASGGACLWAGIFG